MSLLHGAIRWSLPAYLMLPMLLTNYHAWLARPPLVFLAAPACSVIDRFLDLLEPLQHSDQADVLPLDQAGSTEAPGGSRYPLRQQLGLANKSCLG